MSALLGLAQLQQLLQSVHGVQAAPVREFLVDGAFRERHAPFASPHEALLLRERGEELHVALFLDDGVLAQLARSSSEPWSRERLSGFCAAAEGVSHFLYVTHRAGQGGQVSQLELEAQGELDKYLAVLLQLWATGRRAASPALRRNLFERSVLRPGLTPPERDRYRLASALAAACARAWEARYVLAGRLDALLRDARRLYRLSGGEKFSALAQGELAWAA
ncbi:MAG TPA: hypothetical protein VFL36_21845 [Myxococcales bacterium]|nr:hypothetical protein [Myxococcales bacterium]